jgi:hypothetical protein
MESSEPLRVGGGPYRSTSMHGTTYMHHAPLTVKDEQLQPLRSNQQFWMESSSCSSCVADAACPSLQFVLFFASHSLAEVHCTLLPPYNPGSCVSLLFQPRVVSHWPVLVYFINPGLLGGGGGYLR